MNLSRTQIMFSKLIPLLFLPFISISGADIITLTLAAPGGSKFDNLVINAAGQAFYAGLETPATYCPTVVQQCPHNGTSTETVFGNLAALWVNVPGGQQVYTRPDGAMGFTQAHSAYIPPGSFIGGFTNLTCGKPPRVLYTWPQSETARGGIHACPVENSKYHKIYVGTPQFNRTDCSEVKGLQSHPYTSQGFGAWQYT